MKRYHPPQSQTEAPHSTDSEAVILRAILAKGEDMIADLCPPITEDHFYNRHNRQIFSAAWGLHSRGKQVDLITVIDELQRLGQIDECGGSYEVAKLCTGSIYPVEHHKNVLVEKRRLRRAIDAAGWVLQNAGQAEDSTSFLAKLEQDILDISEDVQHDNLTGSAGAEVLADIEAKRRGEVSTGVPTGIRFFDDRFGGLKRGRMIVIGARPGRGKTAMVEQIAERLTADHQHVLFFEKDIHPSALMGRMACRLAGVPFTKLDRGRPSVEDFAKVERAVRNLTGRPLTIMSPPRLTGYDIRSIVRRSARKNETRAVILDHFQLLDFDEQDQIQGLTRASIQIKQSAQDTGIPHLVVAQLNRLADGGRPSASTVKGCDQLFADCDILILLWGEEEQEDIAEGELLKVKCTVAKNRFGPTGEEELLFDGKLMRFVDQYQGSLEPEAKPLPYKD